MSEFFVKFEKKIKSATLEEILQVRGINKVAAGNLKKFFRSDTMQKKFLGGKVLEKITEIEKKMELILTVGQILNENGAMHNKIIRVLNRIAIFMKIPTENIRLNITKQSIFFGNC